MQKWLIALLALALTFAGCLGSDSSSGENGKNGQGGPASFDQLRASVVEIERYAPEPNIGITSDGSIFVSAFSDTMRSTDGGATFEVVHTHEPSDLNNDPMLWVDTVTDRVYSAPMMPIALCSQVYWSDNSGDAWSPTPAPACGTGAFDHQKFATGLPGPGLNPLAGVQHETVAYICYNGIAITNCMASYDGGQTWPIDRPTSANAVEIAGDLITGGAFSGITNSVPVLGDLLSPCLSGQNGHPTAGPDGTVAFLRTWSCVQPILTFSQDNGLTWTNVAGPEFPGGPSDFLNTANAHSIDPEVAFTADGTMYVLFQSWDHHAYIARTSDLGGSWEGPWDITPPGTNSTVFAALAAGDDGRIAAAFHAADVSGSSTNAPEDARWNLFFVVSDNADSDAPDFAYLQAEADPVQVGPILQGGGTDNTRNLLDFIDGAVSPDGEFFVAFSIGCTTGNGCRGADPSEQTSAARGTNAAVAKLTGFSLYDSD